MDVPTALEYFGYTTLQEVTKVGLKKKYKNKAKRVHPDIDGGSQEQFIYLKEAYTILLGSIESPVGELELLRKAIIEEQIQIEKAELERRLRVVEKSELLTQLIAAEKKIVKHNLALKKQTEFLEHAKQLVRNLVQEYESDLSELEGEMNALLKQLEQEYTPSLMQRVVFFLPRKDMHEYAEKKESLVSTFRDLKLEMEHDLSKAIVKMYGDALNQLTSTLAELDVRYEHA